MNENLFTFLLFAVIGATIAGLAVLLKYRNTGAVVIAENLQASASAFGGLFAGVAIVAALFALVVWWANN